MNNTASVVEYGVWGGRLFELTAKGQATLFEDGGSEKRSMFIHRVMLTDLKPDHSYGTDLTYGECMGLNTGFTWICSLSSKGNHVSA